MAANGTGHNIFISYDPWVSCRVCERYILKRYMRGCPSSGQDNNHFCFSQEKVWPRHGSNSVPPHFCPEGIPSSWANVVRKLSGISCCHGVSVGVLSFLTSFVINIVAVTAGFVITLLFPVHCSYLSWRSWPIVPPAGAGRSGSGSWF